MKPLLEVENLQVSFAQGRNLLQWLKREPGKAVAAVDGVSFSLRSGETLGLVGESGCGKTTLGRALMQLISAQAGSIRFKGERINDRSAKELQPFRRKVQMIFQDPYTSLNPRLSVGDAIAEVLRVHKICAEKQIEHRVAELLQAVGLSTDVASRRPKALSGGQCQRVGIARALAVDPELLIADESVSALDVSIQAQILNVFSKLQRERGLAMVFISHDLGVIRHVCQRVAVMYLGKIVEMAPVEKLFSEPKHPYTQALIKAVPELGRPLLSDAEMLQGEPPSPIDVPTGCAFHPRCPQVFDICKQAEPRLKLTNDSGVCCHL